MHPAYVHLDDYRNYPMACRVLDQVFFMGCSPNYSNETLDKIKDVVDSFIEGEK